MHFLMVRARLDSQSPALCAYKYYANQEVRLTLRNNIAQEDKKSEAAHSDPTVGKSMVAENTAL